MKAHHHPRPSAYLWARCEGWKNIGVYHAAIVNIESGEVCDENGTVILRRDDDGRWIEPDKKSGGLRFDQIAVTHLPIDPWQMRGSLRLDQSIGTNIKLDSRNQGRGGDDGEPDLFPSIPD